ncbi:MAG TPA: hypothetical protein DEF35_04985 [Paenibacillus sp.]|uniref:DUF6339 family protein n=1 Tax=Paenibacillus TaxID=44249 RepID=UPI000BA12C74|nr:MULTISPECIES: DUF6339 family protein [Paenibacillus]OZQ60641.1 hypothetical protein CA599_29820 [Paenibacillus taichungensis]HBU80982.1 hypothetical protein [Paenibacillus sp.]
MNLHYVSDSSLDDIKSNIRHNIPYYSADIPWLDEYFGSESWSFPSKIRVEDIDLHMPISSTVHFDLENTKKVYSTLKDITLIQACDERMWTYLAHQTFWNYMRERWPVESYLKKGKPEDAIRERYFFMSNKGRALVRNGIARLWWYGYVSYDEEREDPFELTAILLSKLDIAQSLLERVFSGNRDITRAVLAVIHQKDKVEGIAVSRNVFRSLMMYINQLGGVTILDALDRSELERLIEGKLNKLLYES